MLLHNVWTDCYEGAFDHGCKSPKTISAGADPEARLERADLEPARTAPAPCSREGARHSGDAFARHGRAQVSEDHIRLQSFDRASHRGFGAAAARTRLARFSAR